MPPLPTSDNQLIQMLPAKDRRRLLRSAETVDLTQSEVLGAAGRPTRFVYFPLRGFVSLVTSIDGKPVLEVGMVGREGMFGAHVALGVLIQPFHALVQGAGSAWRVPLDTFQEERERSAPIRDVVHRYLYVLMTQLASAAACARFHTIDARLARWLLMMQDRAQEDSFPVTHVFLGFMLGVRRVGVTIAAGVLNNKGLIEYRRGQVTVLDRKGLERIACCCYRDDMTAYARFMG